MFLIYHVLFLSRVPSPPEKKMKYSPTQGVNKSKDSDSKMYSDDEEDLKAVVAAATAKIIYNGDTSDDGSFQVDINNSKEVGSGKSIFIFMKYILGIWKVYDSYSVYSCWIS